jgi:deoxycytidylate deaminase
MDSFPGMRLDGVKRVVPAVMAAPLAVSKLHEAAQDNDNVLVATTTPLRTCKKRGVSEGMKKKESQKEKEKEKTEIRKGIKVHLRSVRR